jgi:hypothetical protein
LKLGDDWDYELAEAQRVARITVVIISSQTDKAYYQREEIASAIAMARQDKDRHRVVPIYLDDDLLANNKLAYGLRLKHGLSVLQVGGLSVVAQRLVDLLDHLTNRSSPISKEEPKEMAGRQLPAPHLEERSAGNVPSREGAAEQIININQQQHITNTQAPHPQRPAPQGPEFQYPNLFQASSLTLPYVTIIGAWQNGDNEYQRGEVVSRIDAASSFTLPEDFQLNYTQYIQNSVFDPKCRLVNYDCKIMPGSLPNLLTFTFSKIGYVDYLLSGERLDAPLPDNPDQTFRDKYAPYLYLKDFGRSHLTNICGVGIFILTRDGKIIISKHSSRVAVYGGTWSYSASGTMDWGDKVHPFDEIARECFEEIGHRINIEDTYLFEFGLDAKKLYFQFSFFEYTGLSSEEVLKEARRARDFYAEMEDLVAVPFELGAIIDVVKSQSWEPAAAAGLLTLCAKQFGLDKVERVIDPNFVRTRTRMEMLAEWDRRASRPGEFAVMSARYPSHRYKEESEKYIQAVIDFIGNDVDRKDILEIGAGIGRLTEWLALRASELTCLDLSQKMLERNRKLLGNMAQNINYLPIFGQDYRPKTPHDIVISSLVLIHNVDENDFRQLVEMMSSCADTIFLFEHTDVAHQVSSHTRPRSEAELISAFRTFRAGRRQEYQLFNDNLIFLKLVR